MNDTDQAVNDALERAAEVAETHAAACVDPGTGCPFAIAKDIRQLKRASQ